MKYSFPAGYGQKASLVAIDHALIPLISGAIMKFQDRGVWNTPEDYELGYNAFAELQAMLVNNYLEQLLESNRRLYRLVDSIFNGTEYTSDGQAPATVTPAIPDAPPADIGQAPGLRVQLRDLQGELPAGWFGWGSQPATLADVVRAVRADTQTQVDRAKTAFNALQSASQGATIFGVVSDFLSDGAELTAEGGILATLLVSTMSNAAMMGLQANQLDQLISKLDRLIASLDGGADTPPDTNVVRELAEIGTLLG